MVGGVADGGDGVWSAVFGRNFGVDGALMEHLIPLAARRASPVVRCPDIWTLTWGTGSMLEPYGVSGHQFVLHIEAS